MKYLSILLFITFFFPGSIFAYETVPVEQSSPFEISELKDVTTEQWFVGGLNDFPHTFEFVVTEPTTLNVQVMYPAGSPETERISVIVVKEVERGVSEVMRRTAEKVEWQTFTDSVSGLEFNQSPTFDDRLEPGVYRLEVSNPTNNGKYVIKLGFEDDGGGYFNTLKDIKNLRNSLGLSTFGMVSNKYVYVPVFALVTIIFFGWFWYRRKEN